MTSADGARGCLVGACAGRWPSQADPDMVIKRKFESGVASIHGGALWWTRRHLFRAASRQHRELWRNVSMIMRQALVQFRLGGSGLF